MSVQSGINYWPRRRACGAAGIGNHGGELLEREHRQTIYNRDATSEPRAGHGCFNSARASGEYQGHGRDLDHATAEHRQANNGLTLSFSIVGTQVSQQLAQSQTCSLSSLITAATTQAQSLAAAGGFTLGSILRAVEFHSNVWHLAVGNGVPSHLAPLP